MNNIIKRVWNQNSMVIIEDLQGMAFQGESGGHTFQISGIDGEGNAVALSGTPAGVMLRSDNQDVTLTCSISDGKVNATLPANAYSVPGRFGLKIFLTSDGQKTAIYAAVGTVGKTSSGTVAPPAGSDVVDLVNAIATAVGTIPASYTDLMAAMAPTYSSSGLYAVGNYAWYNGKLYRCTTPITSGETWTSGHWTLANLGSDLVDLKSALYAEMGEYDDTPINVRWINGTLDGSGAYHEGGSNWVSADYIPIENLCKFSNNNDSGNAYIDFYTLTNGTYVFNTYQTIQHGNSWYINPTMGTHVRIYINTPNTNVELTSKILLVEQVKKKIIAEIEKTEDGTVEKTINWVHGKLNGSGAVVADTKQYISDDYISVDKLAYVINKTTGILYVDYYEYVDGGYSFKRYESVSSNSVKRIARYSVTHIKLYSSTENAFNKDVVLREYTDSFTNASIADITAKAEIQPIQHIDFDVGSISSNADSYGEETSSTTRMRSEFIPVIPGVTCLTVIPSYDAIRYAIYYYDEYKNCIGVYDYYYYRQIPMSVETVIPTNAYYARFLFRVSNDSTITTEISNSISDCVIITNNVSIDDIKCCYGYYLAVDGSLSMATGAATTTMIKVEPGTIIDATMRTENGTVWMAGALYGENREFIKRFVADTVQKTENGYKYLNLSFPIPENGLVKYVRFSFGANYSGFEIKKSKRMPLPKFDVKSVNHRGYQDYAPENTIPAFKLSKAIGFEWIEADVQYTADDPPIPVIMHDSTINRTARNNDGTEISGDVSVSDKTYEELLEYDFGVYGYYGGGFYKGTRIPTFDETVKLCKDIGLNFRVEFKAGYDATIENMPIVIDIVKKYGMREHVEFVAFDHRVINYIIDNYPGYMVGFIGGTIDSNLITTVTNAMTKAKNVTCAVDLNNTSENFALLASTGCTIDVYTIVRDTDLSNIDSHVMSFTTNFRIVGEELYKHNII